MFPKNEEKMVSIEYVKYSYLHPDITHKLLFSIFHCTFSMLFASSTRND